MVLLVSILLLNVSLKETYLLIDSITYRKRTPDILFLTSKSVRTYGKKAINLDFIANLKTFFNVLSNSILNYSKNSN